MIEKYGHKFANLIQQNKYPCLLILIVVLCLWPLSFFVYIPKWDNIGGYLPYRYFISDYVWNGNLPLWNPFQKLGYPGYSDLQSGCWNPITWVIMLFGKYTVGSLIIELLFYYILAGLGMFKLGNFLYSNPKTSFIIGLSYALSGFMVGSSQLMVFIIGVAWLPWCIYGLLKFLNTLQIKYAVLTALFIALSTSAASPAYTIVLAYIIIFVFLWFLWKYRKETNNLIKIIIGGMVMISCSILFLLPYLNSFIEFAPYFNRISKLPYGNFLLSNPFTVKEYISFVFPYTVISKTDIFNPTDLTLRNGYFTILGVLLFILSVFTVKNKYLLPLFIAIVISLVLAAGSNTFIYEIAYKLPGFGIFRHPSFFRTYSIFCGLLMAGFALNHIFLRNKLSKKEIRLLFIFTGCIFCVAIITFFKTSITEVKENLTNVIQHIEFSKNTLTTHLFINSLIILLLFGLVYIINKITKISLFLSITIFTILDLGIQATLTAPTTIFYYFTYDSVANYFKDLPNDINQKDNYTPLKYLDEKQGLITVDGVWDNLSTFNKTISYVGVNPMRFQSFDEGNTSGALQRNIENEILFFPQKEYVNGDTLQKGLIWGCPKSIDIDTGSTHVDSIYIGYNSFTAIVRNTGNLNQWLILNQNYHHLWQAVYNEKQLPVYKINDMLMSVEIPKGSEGRVEFMFKSSKTIYFFIISLLSYLIFISYLIGVSLKENCKIKNLNKES